uniref:Cytochrome b561 domain-containing protein n=1 Tax=Salix viminalis TaxID=40686 RepID=A0A6N2KWV8_SALVM
MSSHRLLILCLILCVQNCSCNKGSLVTAVRRSNDLRGSENAETTNLRSWNGQIALHRRRHLGNTHGVLNIIGWGTLLPIGAIVARSFRKSPLKCDEWYNLHVVCQTLGYIIGAVGWSIGMWLGNSSKQYSLRAHRILGIIIFTSSTAQASPRLAIPSNIFQGIGHKDHAEKWKWIYVGILSVLSFLCSGAGNFRFVMPRIHR